MKRRRLVVGLALVCVLMLGSVSAYAAPLAGGGPEVTLLVSGLQGGSGSTVGPDGALYVPETITGNIMRVDPETGAVTTFASGLPQQLALLGIGGVMDVAFIGHTAYALVTLVGSDWGGNSIVGIYRVDGPQSFTVVADIGAWSSAPENLPPGYPTGYDTITGVQYAMQPYRGGFLVTDAHHNRLLKVGLNGAITQLVQLGNVVPSGLALRGNRIYYSEAGRLPHLPEDGKVYAFKEKVPVPVLVASGAPLLVDVEFGPKNNLYALSQGTHTNPGGEGSPADPNTGSIVRANRDNTFTTIVGGINLPTSFEIIGDTAYVIGFNGDIWKIRGISHRSKHTVISRIVE